MSAFTKRRNYDHEKRFVIKYILSLYSINFTLWATFYIKFLWFQENRTLLSNVLYLYSNYIALGVATMVFKEFEFALLCIRSRIKSVNALLRYILPTESFAIQNLFNIFAGRKRLMNYSNTVASIEKNSTDDVRFINSMARLHSLLCDIVDDLNACFSIQVFN